MRARHITHSLPAFWFLAAAEVPQGPVLRISWYDNTDKLALIIHGSYTSVQRLYNVGEDMKLGLLDELELEKGEDAPMSMTAHSEVRNIHTYTVSLDCTAYRVTQSKTFVCGVNSSTEKLRNGQNENCHLYGLKEDK